MVIQVTRDTHDITVNKMAVCVELSTELEMCGVDFWQLKVINKKILITE
jgi:hypothetical protein